MTQFKVSAEVTVDVVMVISAKSEEEARSLFDRNIMMTAGLSDVEPTRYEVQDDSIGEMGDIKSEVWP